MTAASAWTVAFCGTAIPTSEATMKKAIDVLLVTCIGLPMYFVGYVATFALAGFIAGTQGARQAQANKGATV